MIWLDFDFDSGSNGSGLTLGSLGSSSLGSGSLVWASAFVTGAEETHVIKTIPMRKRIVVTCVEILVTRGKPHTRSAIGYWAINSTRLAAWGCKS